MKQIAFSMCVVGLLVALLLPPATSHAGTILYEPEDLFDTTPAQDLWQYTYTVSDYSFDMDHGFTVYFDYVLCSDLESPPPAVNADWDPIVWQPDLLLPDDGAYDARALSDGASLSDSFVVSFVWLGSGVPGPQTFEIYDPDFNRIELGQTTPVPIPATILLLGSGLCALAGLRKSAKKYLA
jgi:hypothetical protein